jgi:predicted HTH domain antitoxin
MEQDLSNPRIDRDTLTLLVLWAYDHEEITVSRAAEILQVPLVEFRERYKEWTETEKK